MQPDSMRDVATPDSFRQFWRQDFSAGGGGLTQGVSQRLGAVIAYLGYKAGASPNLLTVFAAVTSVLGSLIFALGVSGWESAFFCALLYQIAYGFDCADGQLARATRRSSEFGGWLDVMADLTSMLFMAFAMLYWIVAGEEALSWIHFCGPLFLAIGRVVVLYSSKFTQSDSVGRKPGSEMAPIKRLLWLVVDTPTLLLAVCVLRGFPEALNFYLAAMGLAYCLNAAYLGFTRLSGVESSVEGKVR